MASLAYLVLFLSLHACAARPLKVFDKETVTQIRDEKASAAEGFEIRHRAMGSGHDANVVQMQDEKFSSIKEARNIEGHKVKTPYALIILQQDTGAKNWKKAGRSTMESSPSDADEENVESKENATVEDIDVMDYAQPHRKPPIHNKPGT